MINKLIVGIFLLIGYFLPLALASVDIWSQTVVHILSLIIALLLVISWWNKREVSLYVNLWKYAVCWLVIAILSARFAANRSLAYMQLFNMLNGVFFFFLAINISHWAGSLNRLLTCWGYVVVPLGLLAFYQFFQNPRSFQLPSSMVNPNILAGYLVFWLPFWGRNLVVDWKSKNKPQLYISFCMLLLIIGSITITYSFTVWGALILAFIIVYYRNLRASSIRIFNINISANRVLLVLGLLLLTIISLHDRFILSIFERIHWSFVALRMGVKHPLLGVGPGGFSEAFLFFKQGSFQNTLYAHNLLFQMAAEIGFVGAAVFAVWIGVIIACSLRKNSGLQSILLVGLISFILKNFCDYGFSVPANAYIFWFWAGLLVSYHTVKRKVCIPHMSFSAGGMSIIVILILMMGSIHYFSVSRMHTKTNYYAGKHDYENAERYANTAIKREPLFPEPYFAFSRIYFDKFQESKNIMHLELSIVYTGKAIRYSKYNKQYHNWLAYLMSVHKSIP